MGISVSTLILIVLSILSLVEIALVITSLYSENDYVIVFSLIPVVFFCILILAGAYSYCIDFENKNNNKNTELKTIQRRNRLNKGKIDNSTTSKNVTGILEQIESFIYQNNKTQNDGKDKGKNKGKGQSKSKNKDDDLPNTKGIFDSLEPTIIDTDSDTDSEIDSKSNLDKVKNKNKEKDKNKDKDNDYNNIDDDFNPNRGSPGLTQMLIDPGTI